MGDTTVNPLEMTDEELMKLPEPTDEGIEDSSDDEETNDAPADDDAGADDSEESNDNDEAPEDEDEDIDDDDSQEDDSDSEDPDSNDEEDADSPDSDDDEDDNSSETDEESDDDNTAEDESEPPGDDKSKQEGQESTKEKVDNGIDYKAEYNKVFAPFKANNKMIQVKSADDVIRLMQMGAHYNKKMTQLKPSLKIVKMLENNKLLTEDKIGFLIDLANKDEGAIKQLIKDSGLDPLDVDVEKNAEYQPKNHTVSDKEVLLEQVLDEISSTPTYDKTLDLLAKNFDDDSKKVLYENPEDIRALNDQVANGIYDLITTEVEQQRALGHLKGVSDIDAYRIVGTDMHNRRVFPGQQQTGEQPTQNANVNAAPVPANKDKNNNSKLKNKRKAAAGTSSAPKRKSDNKFKSNPLNMTDEDFLKLQAP